MNTILLSLVDGFIKGSESYGQGGIIAILCTVMVFIILAIIIGITYLVNLVIQKTEVKQETKVEETKNNVKESLDLTDEDAVVATLVASIDLRNETKKNVKVISVKEIK